MSPVAITLLVIVIVLAIIIAVLYFLGKKAQKKQAEQQELLDANKQTVSMLIIDKKRMKLKERCRSSPDGDRSDTEDDAWFQASHHQGKGWPADRILDL